MYRIKKSVISFILIVFVVFPSVSYAKATISDLSLSKNSSGKTEITINSSEKYKYLVHAIKNDLIVVFDDATFSDDVIRKFSQFKSFDPNITSIDLDHKADGSSRIVIHSINIKDFKFYIDAKNGIAAPYGFDKPVVKANNKKIRMRSHVTKRPEAKKQNVAKKTQVEFNSVDSEPDLFMPADISNHSDEESKRLDLSNVLVPEDYYEKPESSKKYEPEPIDEPVKQELLEPEAKNEVVKNLIKKPIPMSELMKTLTDNNDSEVNVPRMVEDKESKYNEDVIKPDLNAQVGSKTLNIPENKSKEENNNIIKSIKEVPNGSLNKPLVLTPDGSHTVSNLGDIETFKENYEVKNDVKSFIPLQPRGLSFLPLGFSEEFNFDEPAVEDDFTIPKPKSAMTSDGMLAFTVITPEGSYEKRAPVKQIATVQDNNYSYMSSGKSGVIDVSRQFSEEDKLKFKRLIIEAKDFYDSGSSSAAEIKYKQAVSINPQKPWGYVALAGFYEAEERYNEAIQSYKMAIKYLPDKIELLYNIALNYYREGKVLNAEKYLNKVISISPNFVLAYYNLGTLYYKQKEYDKAIDFLGRSVKLNPVLTDAYYNLGLAYLYKDKKEEALNSFQQCSSIDPVDKQCSQMVEKLKQ